MTKPNAIRTNDGFVLWQSSAEGVGEPALYGKRYSDCIELRQGQHAVLLNFESIVLLSLELKRLIAAREV